MAFKSRPKRRDRASPDSSGPNFKFVILGEGYRITKGPILDFCQSRMKAPSGANFPVMPNRLISFP